MYSAVPHTTSPYLWRPSWNSPMLRAGAMPLWPFPLTCYGETMFAPLSLTRPLVPSVCRLNPSITSPVCRKYNTSKPKEPQALFRPWLSDNVIFEASNKIDAEGETRSEPGEAEICSPLSRLSQLAATSLLASDDESKSTLETCATNLGKSSNGYRCIFCSKVYSRKYGLKIHLRVHTGFKPLKCKICHRAFGDPSNLNKHSRLHAETKNACFKCDICGKCMIRKRDLDRHVQSRHGCSSMEATVLS